jgi:hypothetical protein
MLLPSLLVCFNSIEETEPSGGKTANIYTDISFIQKCHIGLELTCW